ncbi:MAG: ABC transporter ATP-binding protein [Rhizobiaceae bacterium]|nr:ABC transporter ATP-binding protein [Rhizobiaceae bacterium]
MTEAALELKALRAWYGESQVLHGVDMTVPSGQTVTLLGRNGVGKSTTLKSIMGVIEKRDGDVLLKGRSILHLPLHQVARLGLGYVPEERGIFASLNVMENLTLPPQIGQAAYTTEELLELFPNLRERAGSQGTKLSGGEQQMLAIARILRTGADILLLDEPAEGLAPVIVQRIAQVILGLKQKGMTILLVEQNFRFARKVADHFYLMEDGRIIDSFPADQLSSRSEAVNRAMGL